MKTMNYKGCVGSIEFSETDNIYFGSVQGIRSLLSYEGSTEDELRHDFRAVVDEYLNECSECKFSAA